MKDVVRCDKLREGANSRRSVDFRMGQPTFDNENFEAGRPWSIPASDFSLSREGIYP